MAIVYETIVKEDLDLGTGQVTKTNPGGGVMQGSQINLATFAFATKSQTWAPGSILAGLSVSVSIPIKGVLPGDFVLASFSGIAGNVNVYGQAGTDAVVILATNAGPSGAALPSGTLKVMVFKTP